MCSDANRITKTLQMVVNGVWSNEPVKRNEAKRFRKLRSNEIKLQLDYLETTATLMTKYVD